MKVEQLSKMTIAFKVCWYTLQNTSITTFHNTDTSVKVEVDSTHMWFYNCACLFKKKSQSQPDRHKSQILKGTSVPTSTSSYLKALYSSRSFSNSSAFDSSKESTLDSNCALPQWLLLVQVPYHFTNILSSIFLPGTVLWPWTHIFVSHGPK